MRAEVLLIDRNPCHSRALDAERHSRASRLGLPPLDRRAEATIRLARIAEFAAGTRGTDLRTHLDEWAAFEIGGDLLKRTGAQRWLNNPCPLKEGSRLLQYVDWVSPEAQAILERGVGGDKAVSKSKNGPASPYRIIVEHVVPVRAIGDMLTRQYAGATKDDLSAFLRHHFVRAVLTKAQDERLNRVSSGATGWTLKDSMPEGWRKGGDPFDRYRAAGLIDRGSMKGL